MKNKTKITTGDKFEAISIYIISIFIVIIALFGVIGSLNFMVENSSDPFYVSFFGILTIIIVERIAPLILFVTGREKK